ncbi:MAG: alpha-amylase family glycosyl hydrolase [Trueperaceae bacterium]|nr:alpha-amylase family glycosyl hydrolase [Trueperaceae bacterium]
MIILELPDGVRLRRDFHVTLAARRRYGVEASLVDLRGRVLVADPAAAERMAARMNEGRDTRRFPEAAVSGAEIVAAGLLDEAIHLMLNAYRREHDPGWTSRLDAELTERLGAKRLSAAKRAFVAAFPPADVMQGNATVETWLAGSVDAIPSGEVALEERIAVRLANENPALERFRELVDDRALGDDDAAVTDAMERKLASLPGLPDVPESGDLWSLLQAPMRASPTSLEGQLQYVRDHWGPRLGAGFEALLAQLARSLDMLSELRAGGAPGPPGPAPVLDRASLSRGRDEPEAYSPDADWMPSVVLVAKNAYVWLDQLSRWSGREVRRLDDVPDEALADLRSHGFTGLWLIGLWERSEASARIKRLRGQADAVASAYALYDYQIAVDLGGDDAWRNLRDRAWRHGIRLAADMVPNHVGIDGRWVVEHPDRFLSLPQPPYPGYTFTGPDLSGDDAIEVRIEDGYWESRDAAVVFERVERATGERRYVYHGNDGTTMPWNDTAQIDYLNAEARRAVIDVILDVARRFPIIRFDAAMTLAKQHVQRLWYPPPGHGGAIPSRSAYGSISDEEFDRRMPVEFWREVVDRVAEEAPDTLLLAEAFWMMEGYFVRTLGMHRVYNSAFMNMLAREANEDYQSLMRNVLEFDPQILGRFVNFMNNPDEETTIAQFGDGDKAYGVATLMATLPGLPMFGHGQVEGLREKYGMEYRRAKLDERPEPGMVARHRAQIAPLLERRPAFAGTDRFRLFEVDGSHGPVHDLFAYANGEHGGPANLVLYHNRFGEAHGTIRQTVPFSDQAGGGTHRQRLGDALGLRGGVDRFVRYRELASGDEHLARSDAWRDEGLSVHLGAYQCRVLLDVREIRDTDGSWERLFGHLDGRGVPDLDDAMHELALAPLHRAFASLASESSGAVRPTGPTSPDTSTESTPATSAPTQSAPTESAPTESAPAERGQVQSGQADPREPASERAVASSSDAVSPATAPPSGLPSSRDLEAFQRAAREVADDLLLDEDRLRTMWTRVPADAEAPGAAWRRAWAVAASFERPADAARRLRLDRAVASRLVRDEPLGVSAEGWATLWLESLPTRRARDTADRDTADRETAGTTARPAETAETGASARDREAADRPRETERGDVTSATASPEVVQGVDPEVDPEAVRTVRSTLSQLDEAGPVRTVLGVHVHEGVRWYRSEGYAAWRGAWLAVQLLNGTPKARIAQLARLLDRAEADSGYRFDRLVAWTPAERPD